MLRRIDRSTAKEDIPSRDPTWNGMYRVGGVCLLVAGLAILAVAVLSILLGPPPSGGEEYLKALVTHSTMAQLNFGLFALADVLLLLGALALFLTPSLVAFGLWSILAGARLNQLRRRLAVG
jgi:hypothetical protein